MRAPGTARVFVGRTLIVADKILVSTVATDWGSVTLPGWVTKMTPLTRKDRGIAGQITL